jgi:tetratricopeptide (TPR) repeat protein
VHHADDHPEVQKFFSQLPPQTAARDSYDFDDRDHDHDGAVLHGSRRSMYVTAAIALLGLLLIGGFLIYNKLIMPTPEDLGGAKVALPTPEMMRSAPPIETPKAVEPPPRPAPSEAVAPQPTLQAPETDQPNAAAAQASEAYLAALREARAAGFRRNAEQSYLQALALDPRGGEALSGLAMFYLNQGKNDAARQRAQDAVTVDPKNSEGWIVLAAALSALGDEAGARKAYQDCAALEEGKYVGECKRMLR